eukprot:1455543-Lingulodinium_polyedra.AAC.1
MQIDVGDAALAGAHGAVIDGGAPTSPGHGARAALATQDEAPQPPVGGSEAGNQAPERSPQSPVPLKWLHL